MRYQVPQFIEVEDKIFGPLTVKQFLYVAGGSAIGFIIWNLIPSRTIAFIVAAPVIAFFFSLAFFKYNDRPFIYTVESAIKYSLGSKLYIWKKQKKQPKKQSEQKTESPKMDIPKLSDSKLKELSWSLDITEKVADVENNNPNFKV
jgi:hypothetical protein